MNYFKQTPQIPKVKPIIMLIVDDKEDIAPMFGMFGLTGHLSMIAQREFAINMGIPSKFSQNLAMNLASITNYVITRTIVTK